MPYRRLPNTDQARIRALKTVISRAEMNSQEKVVSLRVLTEASNFLVRFEAAQTYYRQCFENQIKSSRKCQQALRKARIYISHFIQVLNLSVIRSEIKTEQKVLYGLPDESFNVPDLLSETAVLEWGERIIRGEKERLKKGGIPIYNPTIAKVSVHYALFKEAHQKQKEFQKITERSLSALSSMRGQADCIILDIWDQVESFFNMLPQADKMEKTKEYGVVYYYRSSEKAKMLLK